MKRTCHTNGLTLHCSSNGTDFTLPGNTADRYIYAYSYDSFGRLTESARYAGFSVNPNNIFTEKNLTYDRNGNILTLTRYGNGNATIKDNFIYSYDGNQLKKFDGTFTGSAITHPTLFGGNTIQTPGTADYIYDGNGNMTLDALRNITLTYDINNLISTVSRNDTLLSTYHYLADGTKYKVMDPDNNGRVYIGPFSYTTAKTGNIVYSYLEGIDTDGGRIMIVRKQSGTQNTYDYTTAFFVRDHLGSTRVMLNAQGDILERNAYYPFGLQMNQGKAYPTLTERLPQLYSGYASSTPARRDLYNGKELQTAAGTDYLDYGFRQYDQTIARWFNIDPKAEKYLPMTPYSFCEENPINCIDKMGDSVVVDKEYQNYIINSFTEIFGSFDSFFSFSNNGAILYNGNTCNLSELQKEVLVELSTILFSKVNTFIYFKKELYIKEGIKRGYIDTKQESGAASVLGSENNLKNNYIVVDPNAKSKFYVPIETTYGGVIEGNRIPKNVDLPIKTNTTDRLFHELGHIIYEGQTQSKVIDFNNKTRTIQKLKKRPYDSNH